MVEILICDIQKILQYFFGFDFAHLKLHVSVKLIRQILLIKKRTVLYSAYHIIALFIVLQFPREIKNSAQQNKCGSFFIFLENCRTVFFLLLK